MVFFKVDEFISFCIRSLQDHTACSVIRFSIFYFLPLQQTLRTRPLFFDVGLRFPFFFFEPIVFWHLPLAFFANPALQDLEPPIRSVLSLKRAKFTHLVSAFVSEEKSTNSSSLLQFGTEMQVSLNRVSFSSQLVRLQTGSKSSISFEIMYCSPSLHGPCRNSW